MNISKNKMLLRELEGRVSRMIIMADPSLSASSSIYGSELEKICALHFAQMIPNLMKSCVWKQKVKKHGFPVAGFMQIESLRMHRLFQHFIPEGRREKCEAQVRWSVYVFALTLWLCVLKCYLMQWHRPRNHCSFGLLLNRTRSCQVKSHRQGPRVTYLTGDLMGFTGTVKNIFT